MKCKYQKDINCEKEVKHMNQKVIVHIDETQKWKLLLHNVRNLLASYSDAPETVAIEILANAEAVDAYVLNTDAAVQAHMQTLFENGVSFLACNNALTGRNISINSILPFVKTVPSGVRYLVDQQTNGYAYIKP